MENPYLHNHSLCPECIDIRKNNVKVIVPNHRCKFSNEEIQEYIDCFEIKVGDSVKYKPYLDESKKNLTYTVKGDNVFNDGGFTLHISNGLVINRTNLIKV